MRPRSGRRRNGRQQTPLWPPPESRSTTSPADPEALSGRRGCVLRNGWRAEHGNFRTFGDLLLDSRIAAVDPAVQSEKAPQGRREDWPPPRRLRPDVLTGNCRSVSMLQSVRGRPGKPDRRQERLRWKPHRESSRSGNGLTRSGKAKGGPRIRPKPTGCGRKPRSRARRRSRMARRRGCRDPPRLPQKSAAPPPLRPRRAGGPGPPSAGGLPAARGSPRPRSRRRRGCPARGRERAPRAWADAPRAETRSRASPCKTDRAG